MTDPAKKRATYADVLAAPPHRVAEVLDGELVVSPRPASPHTVAATALTEELGPPFKRGRGGPGGWIILHEPEVHLRDDIVVPDLAGWRRERLPSIPAAPFFTLAPDWACEVLSPRTALRDRTTKLSIFRREGVGHVWFVDPIARTLEVFRGAGSEWVLPLTAGGDDKVRAEPFDAIELDLAILWADVVLPDLGE